MRAIVMNEIGSMRVEDRPTPAPGAGEVLVRIAATGICGSDIHGYTGENGRRFPGQIMGHESSGTIAALGEGADAGELHIGQPVTFNPVVLPEEELTTYAGREQHAPGRTVVGVTPEVPAAFADYLVLPARNIVPLPESMPIEYGALIEPFAVAVHAVRRVLRPADKRALVVGGGPIGQSTVLALKMHELSSIYISEPDPVRRDLCQRLGAIVLDTEDQTLSEALQDHGGNVDVAVDAVGISSTVRESLEATVRGGSVSLVGMGSPELDLAAYRISTDERSLVGSFTYPAQDFVDAAGYIAAQPSEAAELISRSISPEETDAAFAGLAAGDGTPGKVLVRFDR